jgi:hypothetical protein
MPMNRAYRQALATLVTLTALGACTDEPATGPSTPRDPAPYRAMPPASDSLLPPADGDLFPGGKEFVELAREIPGFAGYWYEGGERVVAVTDPAQLQHAVTVVDARVPTPAADARQGTVSTRAVQQTYDYLTLRAWRDRILEPVLELEGVTFIDLDEAANRLVVGVEDASAQDPAVQRVQAAGVPLQALQFEVSGPLEMDQTLQQFARPLLGGYRIQDVNRANCTLGFGATNPPNGRLAFVTNSHCTGTWFGFDGAVFHQPWPLRVGQEVSDPRGFRCGLLWRCRFSDAALVEVDAGVPIDVPRIARTQFWNWYWPGSLNVVNPPHLITSGWGYPPVGIAVDKVGSTTGWNVGHVRRGCVVTKHSRHMILVCQYFADYDSAGGDSGSPVFVLFGNSVQLTGIHWGRAPRILGRRAIFSPLAGVSFDLGLEH